MGHNFFFVIYFCKNRLIWTSREKVIPKIRKDVQGYWMAGNNFVSYSFLLFINFFLGPMACWTTVVTVTQVRKA